MNNNNNPTINEQICLARRPRGAPVADDFEHKQVPVVEPADGELLLRTVYLSLDPYMRGRMNAERSYAEPVPIGGVMEGGAVSVVERSCHPDFVAGEIVVGRTGWQSHPCSDGSGLRKLEPEAAPISTALGVLGMPGLTAYTGLLNIGQPQPGETVVVAAASGAVGSMVGQIARLKGCRTVGIAGGPEKCRYVVEQLGFDACVNHHADDFEARLAAACGDGIDVYFENVGGRVLRAVIPLLNMFARMPVCGLISQYNLTGPGSAPDALPTLMRAVLSNRVTIRGFIVRDYAAQEPAFLAEAGAWLRQGRIHHKEHRVRGLRNAPAALIGLLRGDNFGKVIVEVSEPPA